MKYVLAIDQSTQRTKALLIGEDGTIANSVSKAHRQIVDGNGFISHDAEEIYRNVIFTVKRLVSEAEVDSNDIAAVGITNQRETTVMFDECGALCPAVVWQCKRSAEIIDTLEDAKDEVLQKTGLPLSPYFPAGKISWLLKYCKPRGKAMFGTVDTYLLYRLTGKYITDISNASRTQLMNINTLKWDDGIKKLFGLDGVALPEILPCDGVFGYTDFESVLANPVPVTAVMGDSNAAFYAHDCLNIGDIKATYGTGTSVMTNIGHRAEPRDKLALSVAWNIGGSTSYAVEGNINYSTAVIGWLEKLGVIDNPQATSDMAYSADPADVTVFVPAFSGLSAPYWRSDVKAAITGMTRVTGKNEIVRAALDSIVFQVSDIMSCIKRSTGIQPKILHADGGGTDNEYLMQTQSDIADVNVVIPKCTECSAFGVAKLAGKAFGIELSLETARSFASKLIASEREKKYGAWQNAIAKL